MNQQLKIIIGVIVLCVISFFAGKMSNPAKIETKIVEVEKLKEVEASSKKEATVKKSSSITKPDGTKIEHSEETSLSSEDALKASEHLTERKVDQTVLNGLIGLYAGAGIRLDEPLAKPYLSGIITYKNLAFSGQSDLKLDHRVAVHIGIQF